MNLSNSSVSDSVNIALGSVYMLVGVLIMLTNFIVIFVILKSKELSHPTLWIIGHMAFWDFLLGAHFCFFFVPYAFIGKFPFSLSGKVWASAATPFLAAQPIINTATVGIDRFIAVRFPYNYPTVATKKNYAIGIFIGYIINTIRCLMVVFPNGKFDCDDKYVACYVSFESLHRTLASAFVIVGTFITIIVCSCVMIYDIKRARKVQPEVTSGGRVVTKVTLMALMTSAVFFLSYIPASLNIIIMFIVGVEGRFPGFVIFGSITLMSNSIWNVFIYTATYLPFRDALIKLFCTKYYRKRRWAESRGPARY